MKHIQAIKKIEKGDTSDLLSLFDCFQGKEVLITIDLIEPCPRPDLSKALNSLKQLQSADDEEAFKRVGIENFLKDEDEADSIYEKKYRDLIS